MKRKPVVSSNIKSIGWEDGTLEVEFNSGAVYRYNNVGETVYTTFLEAQSKGKYFAQYIKGTFEAEKLGPDFKGFTAKRLKDLKQILVNEAEGILISKEELVKELDSWIRVYENDDGKSREAKDLLIAFLKYFIGQ